MRSRPLHKVRRIVIHHSLTRDSGMVSWGAIWRYHVSTRHWSSIGYHAGCELVGDRWLALYGRPLRFSGAHAPGANTDGLGFCLVGDFTDAPPPQGQLDAAADVLADWCALLDLDPVSCIVGHRDVTARRTCPGDAFPLGILRGLVTERLRLGRLGGRAS